ncbi:molybdenum cofactor guanylyltransferase [Marinobacter persicus]|jgi:molybdopterin-guanine dinucleotide biosynthesis protein A|uniref:Molybdopterin-guanine dinucleotide biosynthesis protein A n=1 Tax=Marinobacter persicus TaxID=930118 RepID=A0A2S6G625_9GAMM|nr:molybdenum cofactor guanylyltransferase [Marinobacter persicus]PPK50366.1 molybdopterin-guanine dinucleotide biosynthesis protein A [Marinobacter persicus]PPK54448.1 molybdopterin-guanine dinucleotide biosynthesis protein A [Marinobacter persicus]PPK57593.1 molybdopterin-guanine dinucleotide biosynthesis protein A [Marinobacter persicus]
MTFSTIILAGGLSSRMGQDKALLTTGSLSLLHHMQALARSADSDDILVSRNAPGFIPDNFSGGGPLAGLEACLPHCRHLRVLVLAVDTPLLSTSTLQKLVSAAESHPVFGNNSPLPCVLHSNKLVSDYVRSLLMDPNQKAAMHRVLDFANARAIELKQNELFNANTPTDWQHCRQQLQIRNQHG